MYACICIHTYTYIHIYTHLLCVLYRRHRRESFDEPLDESEHRRLDLGGGVGGLQKDRS